jgi:hypothetical protein
LLHGKLCWLVFVEQANALSNEAKIAGKYVNILL